MSLTASPPLNRRERQVAALIAEGQTNKEIGERLDLSKETVKNYVAHIMEKTGARNRVEIATGMLGNGNGHELPGCRHRFTCAYCGARLVVEPPA